MKTFRPYRFPPLSQFIAAGKRTDDTDNRWQDSIAQGFEQGQRDGYEVGLVRGQQDGYDAGRAEGLLQGRAEGKSQTLVTFEHLARPLDAILKSLQALRADYRAAQRKEVVDLVAKVARQVIRAELALQPVQLLSLVDETLAAMPPTRDEIDVFLNPEELARIIELDPKRAKRWNLIADARLDAGECRIRAGDNEVDAGCHQRLAACMDQVSSHLALAAEQSERNDAGTPAPAAVPAPACAPVPEPAFAPQAATSAPAPDSASPSKEKAVRTRTRRAAASQQDEAPC